MKLHDEIIVKIKGKLLKLTNLEKVLWPETGFTKKDLLLYYQKTAPTVLPHLRDRPFTFYRFPDGVGAPAFFEKNCPAHRPTWIKTAQLGETRHCLLNDEPSLIWAASLAALELNTTLATVRNLERPTCLVFDLDPGEGAGIEACVEVAVLLRAFLRGLGLESFVKTSGKKGLHVYIPLNSPTDYSHTKPFAHAVAHALERAHPDLVVSKMLKKHRTGKVLIDWSQNEIFKTTATVYSLRPNAVPGVSTPITWEELRRASGLSFEPDEVLKRVGKKGDLFRPVLEMRQVLPRIPLRVLTTFGRPERPRLSERRTRSGRS